MAYSVAEKNFRNCKSPLLREHTANLSLFSIHLYKSSAPRARPRELCETPAGWNWRSQLYRHEDMLWRLVCSQGGRSNRRMEKMA